MKKKVDVLVVDDEAEILQLLELLLSRRGFTVETAANGFDAMSKLQQYDVKVLLTDLKMPALDGMKLIELARMDFPEVKVLVFTGFGSIETEDQAMRMGVSKYFLKPLPVEELLTELNKACRPE
jgi:DNA-binding NtrC family response regulator